jgi:ribosomal protein L29
MKREDVTGLSDEALVHHEMDLERQLVRFNLTKGLRSSADTTKARGLRRGIARAQTELRRREIASGGVKGGLRVAHQGSFRAKTDEVAPASADFLGSVAGQFSE